MTTFERLVLLALIHLLQRQQSIIHLNETEALINIMKKEYRP